MKYVFYDRRSVDYSNFLKDDIEVGLLKLKRVGMIRRTLTFKNSVKFEELVYLPYFRSFVVLKFGGFE
jgi:hypothetical protein